VLLDAKGISRDRCRRHRAERARCSSSPNPDSAPICGRRLLAGFEDRDASIAVLGILIGGTFYKRCDKMSDKPECVSSSTLLVLVKSKAGCCARRHNRGAVDEALIVCQYAFRVFAAQGFNLSGDICEQVLVVVYVPL